MDAERVAVAHAVRSSHNLNVAAERLGASRRTLQNRMREFGMGYGKSGRPRQDLPKSALALNGIEKSVIGGAALLFGASALYVWWLTRRDARERAAQEQRGMDAILGR